MGAAHAGRHWAVLKSGQFAPNFRQLRLGALAARALGDKRGGLTAARVLELADPVLEIGDFVPGGLWKRPCLCRGVGGQLPSPGPRRTTRTCGKRAGGEGLNADTRCAVGLWMGDMLWRLVMGGVMPMV